MNRTNMELHPQISGAEGARHDGLSWARILIDQRSKFLCWSVNRTCIHYRTSGAKVVGHVVQISRARIFNILTPFGVLVFFNRYHVGEWLFDKNLGISDFYK